MAVRKLVEKVFKPDENGDVYVYFEGFCNSEDEKPIDFTAEGSNLIESDTGDWYFFNENAGTWNKLLTIDSSNGAFTPRVRFL